MILAISGLHGTGKSTVGRKVAESLGMIYFSAGDAFRELAKLKNMTLEEFSTYVEENEEIDKKLDEKIVEVAKRGNTLIESQLSAFLLEGIADFKILLTCPLEVRVKRMAGRDGSSYEEALKETEFREKSELDRFKLLYNIDLSDKKKQQALYDFILNTEDITVEESVEIILNEIKKL